MDKSTRKMLIVLLIIAICWYFPVLQFMRYLIMGDKDVVISAPTAFSFRINGKIISDLYSVSGLTDPSYITIDEKYFNNDDVDVYVTGYCWNYPYKPLVKVNGKVIDDVSIEDTGYAQNVFSYNYFDKCYHFFINETIEENKEYRIYTRANNASNSIIVIFTTRDTNDGKLIEDY